MRKVLAIEFVFLLGILLFASHAGYSQQRQLYKFEAKGAPIPDYQGTHTPLVLPIEVSKLPVESGVKFGLERVCFTIMHTKISNLKIELVSPDGTQIWLTNRNGGDSGQNYIETCLADNGFSGYLYEGRAPFSGSYIPDGRLSDFNNGHDLNGTWFMLIHDLMAGDEGEIQYARLEFGNEPAEPKFKPCNSRNGFACKCPNPKKKKCDLLPDLIVSAKMTAIQSKEYGKMDETYPRQFRLAVATANIGHGPLETRGTNKWYCNGKPVEGPGKCPDGTYARQTIEQTIYRKRGDKIETYTRSAGTNYYDSTPGHNHFHADDWIEITLRVPDPNISDPRKLKVLSKGHKVSYCLFDSGNCLEENELCQDKDGSFKGYKTLANYGFGHYIHCESDLQGISVGGVDNYGMAFEGQYVDIPEGTCNGNYILMVEVDPTHRYLESDRSNNYITMPIRLELQNSCTE